MTLTVAALLARASARLAEGDGDGDAAREAQLLLGHVLQRPHSWLYAHADDRVEAVDVAALETLVDGRVQGQPMAYLLGSRGFWSLDLHVTPAVLIPRPETELLVELALQRIPVDRPCAVADLGTGSGAIALAIASERPLAQVLATDIMDDALAVARANAARLQLANVSFASGDWLAPLADRRFHMLVSNPPYIASDDAHLQAGDLRFEPPAALASGSDGLDALRVICAGAADHLHDNGWLLLEHGHDQGAAVRALLASAGLVDVCSVRDLQQHERVTLGRRAAAAPVPAGT